MKKEEKALPVQIEKPEKAEKKEAGKKEAPKAEKAKEAPAKPEEKVRGPQYVEFYEAREIEKIIER